MQHNGNVANTLSNFEVDSLSRFGVAVSVVDANVKEVISSDNYGNVDFIVEVGVDDEVKRVVAQKGESEQPYVLKKVIGREQSCKISKLLTKAITNQTQNKANSCPCSHGVACSSLASASQSVLRNRDISGFENCFREFWQDRWTYSEGISVSELQNSELRKVSENDGFDHISRCSAPPLGSLGGNDDLSENHAQYISQARSLLKNPFFPISDDFACFHDSNSFSDGCEVKLAVGKVAKRVDWVNSTGKSGFGGANSYGFRCFDATNRIFAEWEDGFLVHNDATKLGNCGSDDSKLLCGGVAGLSCLIVDGSDAKASFSMEKACLCRQNSCTCVQGMDDLRAKVGSDGANSLAVTIDIGKRSSMLFTRLLLRDDFPCGYGIDDGDVNLDCGSHLLMHRTHQEVGEGVVVVGNDVGEVHVVAAANFVDIRIYDGMSNLGATCYSDSIGLEMAQSGGCSVVTTHNGDGEETVADGSVDCAIPVVCEGFVVFGDGTSVDTDNYNLGNIVLEDDSSNVGRRVMKIGGSRGPVVGLHDRLMLRGGVTSDFDSEDSGDSVVGSLELMTDNTYPDVSDESGGNQSEENEVSVMLAVLQNAFVGNYGESISSNGNEERSQFIVWDGTDDRLSIVIGSGGLDHSSDSLNGDTNAHFADSGISDVSANSGIIVDPDNGEQENDHGTASTVVVVQPAEGEVVQPAVINPDIVDVLARRLLANSLISHPIPCRAVNTLKPDYRGPYQQLCTRVLDALNEAVMLANEDTTVWMAVFFYLPLVIAYQNKLKHHTQLMGLVRCQDKFEIADVILNMAQKRMAKQEAFRNRTDLRRVPSRSQALPSVKKVKKLIADNRVGKAIDMMKEAGKTSVVTCQPGDERILELFPMANAQDGVGIEVEPVNAGVAPYEFNENVILACVRSAPKGSANGLSGWTYDLMRQLLVSGNDTVERQGFIPKFCTLVNRIAVGNIGEILPLFNASRLIALGKPNGKIRPLAVADALVRIVQRLWNGLYRESVSKNLAPLQFGITRKSGCELIAHAVRCYTTACRGNDLVGVLQLDISNAFNSISRMAVYNEVVRQMPLVAPLFRCMYGSAFSLIDSLGNKICSATLGVRQGDPLSAAFFSFGHSTDVIGIKD